MRTIKPIFLFADSQILFWQSKNGLYIDRIRKIIDSDPDRPEGVLTAAYIGASNGDKSEYYDIFVAAMNQIGIETCRHIRSKPTTHDYSFLRTADLVLLAGGSTVKGWNVFKNTELQQRVVDCYHNGAVLIGISAGAIQLGLRGWRQTKRLPKDLFPTFQLVPAVIDVHDTADWDYLKKVVVHVGDNNRGYGIPAGGGAAYHPDWSFEAIHHHLVEYFYTNGEVIRSLIFPKQDGAVDMEDENEGNRGKIIRPDEVLTSGIINIDPEILEK